MVKRQVKRQKRLQRRWKVMRKWRVKNSMVFNYSVNFNGLKNDSVSSTTNNDLQMMPLPPMFGVGKRFNKRFYKKIKVPMFVLTEGGSMPVNDFYKEWAKQIKEDA